MNFIKKNFYFVVAAVAAMLLALTMTGSIHLVHQAQAAGHIQPRDVVQELRTENILWPASVTAIPGTDQTALTNGVLYAAPANVTTYSFTTQTRTPYPCKLQFGFTAASAGTCAANTLVISGRTQFGTSVSETLATAASAVAALSSAGYGAGGARSTNVYENVTSILMNGAATCTAGGGADRLVVSCSPEYGLPYRLTAWSGVQPKNGIVQLCDARAGAYTCVENASITMDSVKWSVDLGASFSALGLTRGDLVEMRVRWPAGL